MKVLHRASYLLALFVTFVLPGKLALAGQAGKLADGVQAVFPAGSVITQETLYLDDADRKNVTDRSGYSFKGGVVHRFKVVLPEGETVWAYLDRHLVRTLPEMLLVTVTPEGVVKRLDVLAFHEPEEYKPGEAWYAQFDGRQLDEALALKRGIQGVTGATLTGRATVKATRQMLALHQLMPPRETP